MILHHLKNGIYASRIGSGSKQKTPVSWFCSIATSQGCVTVNKPAPLTADGAATWTRRSYTKRAEARPHQSFVVSHQTVTGKADRKKKLFSDVREDPDKGSLIAQWEDGDEQEYPYVWLRDNCRCEECFHSSAFSRSVSFPQLDVGIRPSRFRLSYDLKKIELQWEDGHNSSYDATWLHKYRFDHSEPDLTLDPKLQYWGSDLADSIKEYDLDELTKSDECLYDWILQMKIVGMALVRAGSTQEGQVIRIGNRVSFLRCTDYGYTSHVKAKYQDAVNIAFTNKQFPMHVDLVFLGRPPGANIIHCIEQAKGEGGENWFVDGFKMAEDLRKEDPEAFRLLTNTELEFFDIGNDFYGKFHQRSRHPTISLDSRGRPDHIHVSDHGRDPMLRMPVRQIQPFYNALKAFSNKIYDPDNVFSYKLKEGDIMTFDNRRVIHGRRAFQTTTSSSRHLETGYLEWDELDSRLRVLHKQLGYQQI